MKIDARFGYKSLDFKLSYFKKVPMTPWKEFSGSVAAFFRHATTSGTFVLDKSRAGAK